MPSREPELEETEPFRLRKMSPEDEADVEVTRVAIGRKMVLRPPFVEAARVRKSSASSWSCESV